MENASKALIIAGAILLAILLISLGIYIYSQANSVIEGNQMNEADKTTFNNKFLKYEGERGGAEVKTLLSEVFASNKVADETGNGKKIAVTGATTVEKGAYSGSTSDIATDNKYTVSIEFADGLVDTIDIQLIKK